MGRALVADRDSMVSFKNPMTEATQRVLEKTLSAEVEQQLAVIVRELSARDFDRQPLLPDERGRFMDLLGATLIALGLSTREGLQEMYEGIAGLASETFLKRPRFEESLTEIMKRDIERNLLRL